MSSFQGLYLFPISNSSVLSRASHNSNEHQHSQGHKFKTTNGDSSENFEHATGSTSANQNHHVQDTKMSPKVEFSVYGNTTMKGCRIENNEDKDKNNILIVQKQDGDELCFKVPRAAANIIAALQDEINTLKIEIDRSRSSLTQSMQPTQDTAVPAKMDSTRTDGLVSTTSHSAMVEEATKPILDILPRRKKARPVNYQGEKTGRWSSEEHRLFLQGLKMHGKRWVKVAKVVKTRTDLQIRTHAQKYFKKLAKTACETSREELDDETIYRLVEADLTSTKKRVARSNASVENIDSARSFGTSITLPKYSKEAEKLDSILWSKCRLQGSSLTPICNKKGKNWINNSCTFAANAITTDRKIICTDSSGRENEVSLNSSTNQHSTDRNEEGIDDETLDLLLLHDDIQNDLINNTLDTPFD